MKIKGNIFISLKDYFREKQVSDTSQHLMEGGRLHELTRSIASSK